MVYEVRWNAYGTVALLARSFRYQLMEVLGYCADNAKKITGKAESRYKEIIA